MWRPEPPELQRRRRPAAAMLVALVAVAGLLFVSASPTLALPGQGEPAPVAEATTSACGNLPVISEACNQLLDGAAWVAECGLGGIAGCTADVTQTVVAGAFDYFAQWVAVGAIGAIDLVWIGIDGTTTPVVDPSASVFQTSMVAARSLALPLLVLAALYSAIKRDAEMALKAAFFYLPGAVLGMVLAGYVITALLAATDELSQAYIWDGQAGIATWLDDLGGSIAAGVGVTAPILLVVFSFILIASSVLLWLIMLVRSAAILITYAFMPLAFAALIFPATRSWIRRLIEVQLSFILAKPVIVAVLSLGTQALNENGNALVGMIQAAALFFLAAFSPFALMKLLPFVQSEALSAMEQPSRAPSRVAATALGVVSGQKIASFLAGSQQSPPAGSPGPAGASGSPPPSGGPTGGGGPGGGPGGPSGGGGGGGAGGPADGGPGGGPAGPSPAPSSPRPSGPAGGSTGGSLASGSAEPPTSGSTGR